MNNTTLFERPETKSQFLTVRMTPTQKQAIVKLAEQEGISAAQLLLESFGRIHESANNVSNCTLQHREWINAANTPWKYSGFWLWLPCYRLYMCVTLILIPLCVVVIGLSHAIKPYSEY